MKGQVRNGLSREQHAMEAFLADLGEEMTHGLLCPQMQVTPLSFEPQKNWMCLFDEQGHDLYLAFDKCISGGRPFGQLLLAVADALSAINGRFSRSILIAEKPQEFSPTEMHQVTLYSGEALRAEEKRALGTIFVASVSGWPWEETKHRSFPRAFAKLELRGTIPVGLPELPYGVPLARLELVTAAGKAFPVAVSVASPERLRLTYGQKGGRKSTEGQKISITERRRKPMSEKNEHLVPATVRLGSITVAAEDLLTLRPGSEIEFSMPESFVGTLEIEGKAWAAVDISWSESGVTLQVVDITAESMSTPTFFPDSPESTQLSLPSAGKEDRDREEARKGA